MFQKAERKRAKLRMALIGPSGSGKTYSSLLIAKGLGGTIAMIDTEHGSGELYADLAEYDVARLSPPFSPQKYIQAIHAAEKAGYNTLIIDSLSHAWAGQGGLLEEVDKRKASQKNQFTAWRDVTPMHNSLVEAIVQSSCHIIATMRSKTAYDMQKDEKGQTRPVKIGLAPVQRDGMEYEFTLVMDLENEKHMASSSKDRTSLFDGQYFVPGEETGQALKKWLESGSEPDQTPETAGQPQTFQPMAPNKPKNGPQPATQGQVKNLNRLISELGYKDRQEKLDRINAWLEKRGKAQVDSTKAISRDDASDLIEQLLQRVSQQNKEQDPQAEATEA